MQAYCALRLQYVHIFVFKEKNDGLEKSVHFSTI